MIKMSGDSSGIVQSWASTLRYFMLAHGLVGSGSLGKRRMDNRGVVW